MSPPPTHDPESALAESEVTGATAMVFAEIREVMAIPLVTSIWRVLAGIDGALSGTWELAAPMLRTGQPAAALERIRIEAPWPHLARAVTDGSWRRDLEQVRAVVAAYTRGNTLSWLVLWALVTDPTGEPRLRTVPPPPGPWPVLPPLRASDEIDPDAWALVERVNHIGATADQPGVATLWRHLAVWPSLLAAIDAVLGPLEADGAYAGALAEARSIAEEEVGRLAHLRPSGSVIPNEARTFVVPYVTHPGLVQRMVVIGHIVTGWLGEDERPR